MSERLLEPNEVSVWGGDEKLLYSGLLGVADAVPLCFRRHEQWIRSAVERNLNGLQVRNGDLKVDASPKGTLQRAGDPVAAHALLLKHDVRSTKTYVGEALFGSLVVDFEPA